MSESRRRLTITVAGVIFGSAICLCALYCPRVFDVEYRRNGCIPNGGWCGTRIGPPWCLEDCKIIVLDQVVGKGNFPEEEGLALIRKWQFRVITLLAVVGATIGGLVGRLRCWSYDPAPRLKFRHWLIGPAVLFVTFMLVGLSLRDHSLFVRLLDPYMAIPTIKPRIDYGMATAEALGYAALAAIVGWAATVVVLAWWNRLFSWPTYDQVADYDDRVKPTEA